MSPENKLPEDFKKKWVAALRSGEYQQGAGHLHSSGPDTYCCLGVALRAVGIEPSGGCYISLTEELIPEILRGDEDNTEVVGKLIEMNDKEDKDFNAIADYIEANL